LKNNQWTQEREIRKGCQGASKAICGLVGEEERIRVVEIMGGLESSVAKVALFNAD